MTMERRSSPTLRRAIVMILGAAILFWLQIGQHNLHGRAQAQSQPTAALSAPQIDLNGAGIEGIDYATTFTEDDGAVSIVAPDLIITDPDSATLRGATLRMAGLPNGNLEMIAVDTTNTPIQATYNAGTGVLRLRNEASIAEYQQVLRTATYLNSSDDPDIADRSVSFVVTDGIEESPSAVTTIAIRAINDAPVLDNSSDLRFNDIDEDDTTQNGNSIATVLASAGGNPITDADSSDPRGVAIIEAGSSNGKWQYSIDAGATWQDFHAVADTAAVLLNVEARIRFLPIANYSGQATITFRAWDQSSGVNGQDGVDVSINGGTSAFSTATETAVVSILPVNDAPLIDVNGRLPGTDLTAAFISGQQPVSIAAQDAVVGDIDNGEIISLTVTLLNRPDGIAESLELPTPGRIIAGPYDPESGRLELSGAAPLAEYSTVLRSLRYNNTAMSIDPAARLIEFAISDGTNESTPALTSLQPYLANNVPVLDPTLVMRFGDIDEDDPDPAGDSVAGLISSAPETPISDPDDGALQGFAVTAAQNENGIWQFSLDAGQSWLPTGDVSAAAALLLDSEARIRFLPEPDFSGGPRTITIRAWDQTSGAIGQDGVNVESLGAVSSAQSTIAVMVLPTNDAPELSLPPQGVTALFTEDGGPIAITGPTLTLIDNDSESLQSATVTIAGKVAGEPDVLAASTNGSGVTASYSSKTGVLQLSGSASPADYQAILRSITFDNTAQDPLSEDRLVTFQAFDGVSNSNVVTATVQIAPVNDPPRLDLNGEGQAGQNSVVYYDENAAGNAGELPLAPDLWLEDVDNTALDGAELMLEPRPNGIAELLAVRTTGTNITAVYNKATGTLLLSGRDTVANYRKTLSSATYNNTQPFANRALRTVRFRVRDGMSTSDGRRATVVIRPQYAFFPFLAKEVTGPLPTGEPNNICADAFPLASNRSYEFDANDVDDWYRFTLDQSGEVTVRLTEFAPQEGQMLVASGECGDLVRIGHNGDFAETKVIRLGVLAPGTYYVWLINDGPTAEGSPYKLAILVE